MKTPRYALLFIFLLSLVIPAQAQQNGFGGSIAIGHNEVFVSEATNQLSPGSVYIFERDGQGTWTESNLLNASDMQEGWDDRFGRAMATDGTTLLVGATRRDATKGGAYIFEKNAAGNWTETALLSASDGVEEDHLGRVVAVSGDFAFVASLGKNESSGAVYVFKRNSDGSWVEHSMLVGDDLEAGDYFGLALALDGDKALIAAPPKNNGTGAVYAFRYDASTDTWNAEGKVEGQGVEEGVGFGSALAINGNYALVGTPRFEGNIGAAYVFAFDEEEKAWSQHSMLVPFDGDQGRLGSAVAFNGKEAWVGSPGANGFQGAVYIYQFDDAGTWSSAKKLTSANVSRGDFFSGILTLSEGIAIVGVPSDDYGAGSAVVFERDGMEWMEKATVANEAKGMTSVVGGEVGCNDGTAASFDCNRVDLVSFLSVQDIGGGRGVRTNDLWGWTDSETGKEYALVGRNDGTGFVDISNPLNPVFLGNLERTEGSPGSTWRDIKVYKDHAFIVSDGAGSHGMQVFDLTQLRDVQNAPVEFEETAHYDGIHSAHNIVINEDTGYAYSVGSSSGGETCGGGLHMINIQQPTMPTFAGCFSDTETGRQGTGYSHDAQCVTYNGPDVEHQGKEICMGANETALSIADVTDKQNPVALSNASYPNVGYSHQGWLTEDHRYFYMNDELDELQGLTDGTRTLIWDVTDLDDPQLLKEHISENKASDHNLYIRGQYMYQSNYMSGLRVLDISDVENPVEIGYFDTVPYGDNAPSFGGSWSNYPFFKSGVIVVTSGSEGMFILKKKDIDI